MTNRSLRTLSFLPIAETLPPAEDRDDYFPQLTPDAAKHLRISRSEIDLMCDIPVDWVFVAAPAMLQFVVSEMLPKLTVPSLSRYAELGRLCLPLTEDEGNHVQRLIHYGVENGIVDLLSDSDDFRFLVDYGAARARYIDMIEGVRHGLVIGYPLLLQAIANAFELNEFSKGRISSLVLQPRDLFQIDIATGTLSTPNDARIRKQLPPLLTAK